MTNVLYVNYDNFDTNSSTHIFNLANRLVEYGLSCAVAVPSDKATVHTLGEAKFAVCEFDELTNGSPFPDRGGADLVHAWTPREAVRQQTEVLCRRYQCPYIVHLEDNEEFIFSAFTNIPLAQTSTISCKELDRITGQGLSHPVRYRRFLAGASGVTTIIETLSAFVPEGIPTEEIWPGYDEELFYPQSGDDALRNKLGIQDGAYVIAYTGNAHAANTAEMHSLYSAVGLVNRQGHPLKLIRCGRDSVDLLGEKLHFIKEHIIDVGFRPHIEVPRYLALADFLVQPGRANDFNDFRIPSKLPEFLAMGLPVILPKSNIGRKMRHEVDGLIMEEGHNLDIARQLCRLIDDPALRKRVGAGGRAFAEKHLNWNTGAAKLLAFYERVLGRNIAKNRPTQHAVKSTDGIASLSDRHIKVAVGGDGSQPEGKLSTPLPDAELMFLVVGHSDPLLFDPSRRGAVDTIVQLLADNGVRVADLRSVLDFGCGCGRILAGWEGMLHPEARLYGCDVTP